MTYKLSIAVRKDEPFLLELLDSALKLITPTEQEIIYEKWTAQKVISRHNYTYMMLSVIVAIVIIAIILLYVKKLLNEIKKREAVEKELDALNKTLEKKVKDATKELEDRNSELKESLENFQILFDMAMEAMILSENGVMIDANETAAKVLGFTNKSELQGKTLLEFVKEDNIDLAKASLLKSISEPFELNLKTKDKIVINTKITERNIKIKGKVFR